MASHGVSGTREGQDSSTTHNLPFELASVPLARRLLRDGLAGHRLDPTFVQDAELVVTELCSNACEHGRPNAAMQVEVSWWLLAEHLRIEVVDGGPAPELEVQPIDGTSSRGRGLRLVEALSERWSVDRQDGTRVSAELRIVPA